MKRRRRELEEEDDEFLDFVESWLENLLGSLSMYMLHICVLSFAFCAHWYQCTHIFVNPFQLELKWRPEAINLCQIQRHFKIQVIYLLFAIRFLEDSDFSRDPLAVKYWLEKYYKNDCMPHKYIEHIYLKCAECW